MRGLEPCNISLSVPSLKMEKKKNNNNKQTRKYRKRYAVTHLRT